MGAGRDPLFSPATGLPIESADDLARWSIGVLAHAGAARRLYLLAPIVRGRKGEYRKEFSELLRQGFQRVKVDGELYDLDAVPALDKKRKHEIEVVVDRVVTAPDLAQRLAESIETAIGLADGLCVAENADTGERLTMSAKFACPVSGFTLPEIEPRLFSFNNPYGACPACDGLGKKMLMDPELIVPDQAKSVAKGAVEPWSSTTMNWYPQTLISICKHYGANPATPWQKLPAKVREVILYGSGSEPVRIELEDGLRKFETNKPFEGVVNNLQRRWRETESAWMREELSRYMSSTTCESCAGYRLKPEALCVKIAGRYIGEVTELSIRDAVEWFAGLPGQLTAKQQRDRGSACLKEIRRSPGLSCDDVGLDLSERCRARQRNAFRGREPAYPARFADRLRADRRALRARRALHWPASARQRHGCSTRSGNLRELGNTVIVVEHDEDAILARPIMSIDIGPGAGRAWRRDHRARVRPTRGQGTIRIR